MEVLAVVGILALLVGVAVPIFGSLSGNAKQVSREMIKAHLQQARSRAIASGNRVAVVIPAASSNSEISGGALSLIEVTNVGGAYIPVREDPNDPSSPVLPLLQGWEMLPGNIRLVPRSLTSSARDTIADQAETISVKYRNSTVACNFIVFSQNGQIIFPNDSLCIAIAQAVRAGEVFRMTEMSDRGPVFDMLEVNRLTGAIRLTDPL